MFFLQLRQLLWKNFTIRKRSKVKSNNLLSWFTQVSFNSFLCPHYLQFRVATELIWPCILFLILAWVRTKGLKEYRDECKYFFITCKLRNYTHFYGKIDKNFVKHRFSSRKSSSICWFIAVLTKSFLYLQQQLF